MTLLIRPISRILQEIQPKDTIDNSPNSIQATISIYQDVFRKHLEHTIRRWDICFPSEISPLLKSLALYTCMEHAATFVPWVQFNDLSQPAPTTHAAHYQLRSHEDNHRVIFEVATQKIFDFIFTKTTEGDRTLIYGGKTYNSASRTWTLAKHQAVFDQDVARDMPRDEWQWFTTPAYKELIALLVPIHDWSEFCHTDTESVYKNESIRAYQKEIMQQLIENLFPHNHAYICENLDKYTIESRFKWREYQQVPECGIRFREDMQIGNKQFNQWALIVFETTRFFFSYFTPEQPTWVTFATTHQKSVPLFEIESIRRYVMRILPDIQENISFLKTRTWEIQEAERFRKNSPYTDHWFDLAKEIDDLYISYNILKDYLYSL